jgi:hypothetical protein
MMQTPIIATNNTRQWNLVHKNSRSLSELDDSLKQRQKEIGDISG